MSGAAGSMYMAHDFETIAGTYKCKKCGITMDDPRYKQRCPNATEEEWRYFYEYHTKWGKT